MKVRIAETNDLDNIMFICEKAKGIMRSNGNLNQWINGYPSKEIILSDISNGHGFVIVDNDQIRGYFCFIEGYDPEVTYRVIEGGKWLNNDPYGVIHRLASDGSVKGIANACFDFCFSKINNIKVDTHQDNLIMQSYFEKLGFSYCGIIYVNDGTPRKAYQKVI